MTAFSSALPSTSLIMIFVCVAEQISLTPAPPLPMTALTHEAGQLNVTRCDLSAGLSMPGGSAATAP
eukprot:CAMPEP_0204548652 /NCGR_PEP_ID=MMETSP0661-20131031/23739_1 /ASSEMBLY_ACC=CAM_ASM_000606 /TAXON_ID=109239 /ORGANISM="Alexandrium margalefi, Strain AMGDE01CS-322" /LENGTH=66 /DNA_ID=CAMNT_0051555575 /DNA_START=102 /DNA_END=298 /DNA_ORIENTATION=+